MQGEQGGVIHRRVSRNDAVFDLAQTVVAESSGIIAGNTAVDDTTLLTLQTSLMTLELGELLALYLQSFLDRKSVV